MKPETQRQKYIRILKGAAKLGGDVNLLVADDNPDEPHVRELIESGYLRARESIQTDGVVEPELNGPLVVTGVTLAGLEYMSRGSLQYRTLAIGVLTLLVLFGTFLLALFGFLGVNPRPCRKDVAVENFIRPPDSPRQEAVVKSKPDGNGQQNEDNDSND